MWSLICQLLVTEPVKDESRSSPLRDWLWFMRGLLVAALFVTAYLALVSFGQVGQAPGCGPGSGCDVVLSTAWAKWLGLPVPVLGVIFYGAFLVSTFWLKQDDEAKAKRVLNAVTFCAFVVLGMAVWFIGVQAMVIGAFCAYCCAAHGLASLAAGLFLSKANALGERLSVRINAGGGLAAALAAVAMVGGVQVLAPSKAPAPMLVIVDTDLQLDTNRLPLMGPANASMEITCLFDYTCHHCRHQHGIIREVVDSFNGKLACRMVVVPLEKDCNALVERTKPLHAGACEYAKIYLAVHQAAPGRHAEFDRWLFADPEDQKALADVREHAAGLIGADALAEAVGGDSVRNQLQQNIEAYSGISEKARRLLPLTLVGDRVLIGLSRSARELEALVKEHLKQPGVSHAEKPVRELGLDEIVESPDGLIRAKGEETSFTGVVLRRFPNGNVEFRMPVVAGLKHGLAIRWHANGQKAEEMPWNEGLEEGVARAWSERGEKLGERHFQPTAEQRAAVAEVQQLHRERKKLDETVWKNERRAQEYEGAFVDFWDELRASEDKWKVLEEFPMESIVLVIKGEATEHDWGIRGMQFEGGGERLNSAGWSAWLGRLREEGVEVEDTEWHQEEFDPKTMASVFRFVVHATGPVDMRYIVRGRLRVVWTDEKDAAGNYKAGSINVTEALMLARKGKPAFEELARISPEAGQPPAESGPGGTAPQAMPLLVYDLDRDGRSEIILAGANVVYWNLGGGRYKKATLCRHYPARMQAAVLADFDQDGMVDLLGMPEESPPVLYRGGQSGRFEKHSERIEVGLLHGGTSIAVGDIDGDGDLDAWLTQNKPAYTGGQMPTPFYDANDGYRYPSYLLVNDGTGRFSDGTKRAGLMSKRHRRTYSSSLVDLDTDDDLDLVVVNDFAGLDVYLNDGAGNFTDVTDHLGDDRHGFGMSHTLADFDDDEALDLYMVGMDSTTARRLERMQLGREEFPGHQVARMKMAFGNRLFLGGRGPLKQAPYSELVARTGWAWGCTALDFDNDGDRDLYITNGYISGESCRDHCTTFWTKDIYSGSSRENQALDVLFKQSFLRLKNISWNGFEHNVLFMNEGRGSFSSVAFLMNAAQVFDARAMVSDDVDVDGRPDVVMIEKVFERGRDKEDFVRILRNTWTGTGHWIGVRLHEHGRGFSPVGGKITVIAGGRKRVLPVVTGDSHMSQHANQKHFGLGTVDKVDAIEVRWGNGRVTRLENPAVNRYHEVTPK